MTPKAQHAIHAASMRHTHGRYAAMRYAANNSTIALYRLACQLIAAQKAGIA